MFMILADVNEGVRTVLGPQGQGVQYLCAMRESCSSLTEREDGYVQKCS